MKNTTNNTHKAAYSFLEVHLFNLIVGIALGVLGGITLIAVYHTVVLLIAYSWSTIFSILVPAATLILAVQVTTTTHPVHSLMLLIAVFFNVVVLYTSVQAEFLSLIFLIVYVGAIAILFLFVIMLLNVKELTAAPKRKLAVSQISALHLVFPFSLNFSDNVCDAIEIFLLESDVVSLSTEPTSVSALVDFVNYRFIDIQMFSDTLYTYYSYSFMLTALLLLTAMLGAIILATSATDADELLEEETSPTFPTFSSEENAALELYLSRKIFLSKASLVSAHCTLLAWKLVQLKNLSIKNGFRVHKLGATTLQYHSLFKAVSMLRAGITLPYDLVIRMSKYNTTLGRSPQDTQWITEFFVAIEGLQTSSGHAVPFSQSRPLVKTSISNKLPTLPS